MTITDGQAFRSIDSWVEIQKGLGNWNDDKQKALNRLLDPDESITLTDVKLLTMNPLKGFNFTMEDCKLTDDYSILKPVQHKDSEATLLWAIAKARIKNNSVMEGIAEFMKKHNIDAVVFQSAVKVGGSGAVDLSEAHSASEALQKLEDSVINSDGTENKQIIHTLSWKDYGIVSETPEHFFEEEALFGTQVRRIMYGDLQLDHIYNFTDPLTGETTKKTGQQIIDDYSNLIEENLKDSFKEVLELFNNPEELEDYLLKEVSGNPLYPSDMTDYCKFDRRPEHWGEFTKLCNPKNYAKTQQLLMSIFKNRINKQKIAGGS